jgi:hypothetical protein
MILPFLLHLILKINLVLKTFVPLSKEKHLIIFQVDLDYNERYSFKIASCYSLTSFPSRTRAFTSVVRSLKGLDLAKNER